MTFQFQINSSYLLCHTLRRASERVPESLALAKKFRRRYPTGYDFFVGTNSLFLYEPHLSCWQRAASEAYSMMEEATQAPEFEHIYSDVCSYLVWLDKEWKNKQPKVIALISVLTGLELPKKTIPVFVTHAGLPNGKAIPSMPAICWGHPEEWENYSVVYLAHELLHIILANYDSRLMHALIELLADNEIRIRLNERGYYFKENGLLVGHRSLHALERQILPYWQEYLSNSDGRSLLDLYTDLKSVFDK